MAPARARRGRAVLALRGSGEQVCNGVEFDFCPVIFFFMNRGVSRGRGRGESWLTGTAVGSSTLATPAGHSEVTVHKACGRRAPPWERRGVILGAAGVWLHLACAARLSRRPDDVCAPSFHLLGCLLDANASAGLRAVLSWGPLSRTLPPVPLLQPVPGKRRRREFRRGDRSLPTAASVHYDCAGGGRRAESGTPSTVCRPKARTISTRQRRTTSTTRPSR